MKKVLLTLIMAVTLICGAKLNVMNYEVKGIVTEVIQPCSNYPEGLVTFIDKAGNEWSFEGSEDWFEYDYLTAEMCDQGTEWTDDDEILNVTYTGYAPELLINKRNTKDLIY